MQEIRACKHEGSVGMFLQVRACLVQMVHAGVSVGLGEVRETYFFSLFGQVC